MRTTYLDSLPTLGRLYATALKHQATGVLHRGKKPQALPPVIYEVSGVRVDPTHMTSYQHLVGEPASDTLPAGYVHVVGFPLAVAVMARADFPLPLLGLVHLSNRVTYSRPLFLGADLTLRAWAQNLVNHPRGTQVDMVVEVSDDVAGSPDVAWRGVSTYLARGVRIEGLAHVESAPRDEHDHPPATSQWVLGTDVGRAYAQVSGDINPIHTSAVGAKVLGFPRAIAHGMYTAAKALAQAGPHRGDSFEWSVDFAAPVLLPSTVNVAITPDSAPDSPPPTGFTYRGWGKKLNFTGRIQPLYR